MPTGRLASRQKLFAIWRCVFVLAAQAVDVSRGNQLRYDGLASAPCQDCEKRVRIAFAGPIAEGRFDGETLNVTAAKMIFNVAYCCCGNSPTLPARGRPSAISCMRKRKTWSGSIGNTSINLPLNWWPMVKLAPSKSRQYWGRGAWNSSASRLTRAETRALCGPLFHQYRQFLARTSSTNFPFRAANGRSNSQETA